MDRTRKPVSVARVARIGALSLAAWTAASLPVRGEPPKRERKSEMCASFDTRAPVLAASPAPAGVEPTPGSSLDGPLHIVATLPEDLSSLEVTPLDGRGVVFAGKVTKKAPNDAETIRVGRISDDGRAKELATFRARAIDVQDVLVAGDSLYLIGNFSGKIQIGRFALSAAQGKQATMHQDIFVAQLHTKGTARCPGRSVSEAMRTTPCTVPR